jgi:hypothetical protein
MNVLEALRDMELVSKHLMRCPPEIRTLVVFAVAEVDRQLAVRRNPTLSAMCEATPDSLMRDIVADSRRGVAQPSSMAATPGDRASEPRKGTGWRDLDPLKAPPGVDIMDRMMDAADARDRVERMQAAGRQAAVDVAWAQKLAEEQAHRAEAERRSTLHKAPGDPDWFSE